MAIQVFARLRESRADVCTIGPKRTRESTHQDEITGAARMPGKARRLYSRLHPDAEEAQFGLAQSGARKID
jgi:hypothetical protein